MSEVLFHVPTKRIVPLHISRRLGERRKYLYDFFSRRYPIYFEDEFRQAPDDWSCFDLSEAQKRKTGLKELERPAFIRMNFCRWKAEECYKTLDGRALLYREVLPLLNWVEEAAVIREAIILSNIPLATYFAARMSNCGESDDRRADAMVALVLAVDNYRLDTAAKFTSYACISMMRRIVKSFSKDDRPAGVEVFPLDIRFHIVLEKNGGNGPQEMVDVLDILENGELDDREKYVLIRRFGLNGTAPLKLTELGREYGISKERIRQIESRAIAKLKNASKK